MFWYFFLQTSNIVIYNILKQFYPNKNNKPLSLRDLLLHELVVYVIFKILTSFCPIWKNKVDVKSFVFIENNMKINKNVIKKRNFQIIDGKQLPKFDSQNWFCTLEL